MSVAGDRRIVLDPAILAGKPIIKGTRISVELITELFAAGWSEHDLIANYPQVTQADLLAWMAATRE